VNPENVVIRLIGGHRAGLGAGQKGNLAPTTICRKSTIKEQFVNDTQDAAALLIAFSVCQAGLADGGHQPDSSGGRELVCETDSALPL